MAGLPALRALVLAGDPGFWGALGEAAKATGSCDEWLFLAQLRRQALKRLPAPAGAAPLRIAVLGGASLSPFTELLGLALGVAGFSPEVFAGEFDNYQSEIRDPASAFYAFRPQLTVLLPFDARCRYAGALTDPESTVRESADGYVRELLALAATVHERAGGEVLVANHLPEPGFDPGPYRVRSLASDWSYRKLVNLELGLRAPGYVHVCDVEFLASRRGTVAARDARAWFESKQPFAPDLQVDVVRELAHLAASLRRPHAKVAALDLDNTLWGGIIGDDGLTGIEIGDTSPRGEAFKAFQRHLLSLHQRGVLLAVCSKNDPVKAKEPFEKHPEMVLKLEHIASFHASWGPKSESLRMIAKELNLGTDSIVFIDDNPAEIEIVRQFVPEVRTILLPPDPAEYVNCLRDCRYFEPVTVTAEDLRRGELYRHEQVRREQLESVTDMGAYLSSLDMQARISPFVPVDVPRITQLINKSNQFNLTTIRRTEPEVVRLVDDAARPAFTLRLSDKFGDHGLVSIVICEKKERAGEPVLEIDTWVMSCRVLERQVELVVLNEIARLAAAAGCKTILGRFIPTPKNDLVRELLPRLGFTLEGEVSGTSTYARPVASFEPLPTKITVENTPR